MRRRYSLLAFSLAVSWSSFLLLGASHRPPLSQVPAHEAARVNPYAGQQTAVQAGAKLYQRECAACHGAQATGTRRAPALVSPILHHAPPGAVFWVLRNGSLRHGMPSFAHLPEARRWQIITYLETLRPAHVARS